MMYQDLFAGDYLIQVMDANGCIFDLEVSIGLDQTLFIPNVFTPNNDGINDIFFIRNLPSDAQLRITNRWGKTIFESGSYQNDWDGGNNSDAIYYYIFRMPNDPEEAYTGWVEILRGSVP